MFLNRYNANILRKRDNQSSQNDDLTDVIIDIIPNRNNIHHTLKAFDINKQSTEQKEKAKKIKEYESDYLHIDATYFPKFE